MRARRARFLSYLLTFAAILSLIYPACAQLSETPSRPLSPRPSRAPASLPLDPEALRVSKLPLVNGVPYDQPGTHDLALDYVRDSYGWPALARTTLRALYSEGRDKPVQWGQDLPGFGQRFGSSAAITAIDGNVRFAMELAFHEDLRYLPCHRCTVKHKIENALLAEITARHGEDGHRFFTLTPTIADFSGPIIAHSIWYPDPGEGPLAGVVASRTLFATRIGAHLFDEFVIDRRKARKEAQ
jgi:hypothetical protein